MKSRRSRRTHAAEDAGVGAEAVLPQPVAQDHDARVAAQLALLEDAAEGGAGTQHREVAGAHLQRAQPQRLRVRGQLEVDARPGAESGERLGALGEVDVVEGRDGPAREPRARLEDPHQAVGLGIGQRAQQHALDQAVDDRARREAEREREHRRRREGGIAPEAARGVAQVLHDLFDGGEAALVAPLFFSGLERELVFRPAGRFLGVEAGALVLARELGEMEAQLLVEHLLGGAEAEEAEQAGERPAHRSHHPLAGPSSSRLMAADIRSQSSRSRASRRRPAAVRP